MLRLAHHDPEALEGSTGRQPQRLGGDLRALFTGDRLSTARWISGSMV